MFVTIGVPFGTAGRTVASRCCVALQISLLTLPRVWVRGQVTWRKTDKSFGIRFDAADERRQRLKEWIVAYLEG